VLVLVLCECCGDDYEDGLWIDSPSDNSLKARVLNGGQVAIVTTKEY